MKFKAGSKMKKTAGVKRITVKQRAARRRNIKIAREHRKRGDDALKAKIAKKHGVRPDEVGIMKSPTKKVPYSRSKVIRNMKKFVKGVDQGKYGKY